MIKAINTESFKNKLQIMRPGYFDTSKVIFINSETEVELLCLRCKNIIYLKPARLFKKEVKEPCKICGNPKEIKTLLDYQKLAERKGWKYLSNDIPKTTTSNGGWFECQDGHQWNTSSYNYLVKAKNGCPYCSGLARLTLEDYQKVADNKGRYILDYIPPNNKTLINGWLCYRCNNIYQSYYYHIKNGHWCGCSVVRLLSDYQTVAGNKGKYILNYVPERVTETINGWLCYNCNTIYQTSYSRIKDGHWCNCINVKNLNDYQIVAGNKGRYILDYIPDNSNIPINGWLCFTCNQIYTSCYTNVNRGTWCNCKNVKNLNDYQTIAGNKGRYILDYIPPYTYISIPGWQCFTCNYIYKSTYTLIQQGHWCSCVKNKTETILKSKLIEYFPTLIHQFRPDWLKNIFTNQNFSFDFLINFGNVNIIIELDGEQHFRDIEYFNTSSTKIRKRDIYKMRMANLNGYYVIRLLQDDVSYDKNNWFDILSYLINVIISSNSQSGVFYATTSNIYEDHKKEFYNNIDPSEIFEKLTL